MSSLPSSERLFFRKITHDDTDLLCSLFKDPEIMYAWESIFDDQEIQHWINTNIMRYERDSFSFFIVQDTYTNAFIGVIGPLIEVVHGQQHIGIAYILHKNYWGKGYATEGARACLRYALNTLHANRVVCLIRPENRASIAVAKRLGMVRNGSCTRTYKGKMMEHDIFEIHRPQP